MAMAPDVFTTIDPATTPVASSDTSPNGDEHFVSAKPPTKQE